VTDCRKYYVPSLRDAKVFEVYLCPGTGTWNEGLLVPVDEHPLPDELSGIYRFKQGKTCFSSHNDALKKLRKLRDAKVRQLKREIEALQAMKFEEEDADV
jgi:hypothetical protein